MGKIEFAASSITRDYNTHQKHWGRSRTPTADYSIPSHVFNLIASTMKIKIENEE